MTNGNGEHAPLLVPDHLIVWGDVEQVGTRIAHSLGLNPVDGGSHPELGTRNVVFPMDADRYLEVLGTDPHQPDRTWGPPSDHPDGSLWWWAARSGGDLGAVADRLAALGVPTGPIEPGSRIRPSGERLTWKTLDPAPEAFGVALPFAIQWDAAPPVRGIEHACRLSRLELSHPEPTALTEVVAALGLDRYAEVVAGPRPGLRAVLDGPGGTLELSTP